MAITVGHSVCSMVISMITKIRLLKDMTMFITAMFTIFKVVGYTD